MGWIEWVMRNPILAGLLLLAPPIVAALKRRLEEATPPPRPAGPRPRPERPEPGGEAMDQQTLEDNVRRAMADMGRDVRKPAPAARTEPPRQRPKKPKPRRSPPAPTPSTGAPLGESAPPTSVARTGAGGAQDAEAAPRAPRTVLAGQLRGMLSGKRLAQSVLLRELLDRPLAERAPSERHDLDANIDGNIE